MQKFGMPCRVDILFKRNCRFRQRADLDLLCMSKSSLTFSRDQMRRDSALKEGGSSLKQASDTGAATAKAKALQGSARCPRRRRGGYVYADARERKEGA